MTTPKCGSNLGQSSLFEVLYQCHFLKIILTVPCFFVCGRIRFFYGSYSQDFVQQTKAYQIALPKGHPQRLMASTGSIRAAWSAGTIPAITPIITESDTPSTTLLSERTNSKLVNACDTSASVPRISSKPRAPPSTQRTIDSIRNSSRICENLAPNAFLDRPSLV